MLKCSECGTDNYIGTLFCNECGWSLTGEAPKTQPFIDLTSLSSNHGIDRPISTKPIETDQVEKAKLTFGIVGSGRSIAIDLNKTIRVGRSDHNRKNVPELDLTEDQGVEHGVSREHALVRSGIQGVSLVDLGSTNGTELNSHRLPPNEPYPLSNGDSIRFGRLLVRVFFD